MVGIPTRTGKMFISDLMVYVKALKSLSWHMRVYFVKDFKILLNMLYCSILSLLKLMAAVLEYLDLEATKPIYLQVAISGNDVFLVLTVLLAIKRKILSNIFLKYMISCDYWRNNGNNDLQCGCFNMTQVEDGKLLFHLEWP